MRLRAGFLLLAALWIPAIGWGQVKPLRFGASRTWGMPYGDVREEQLVGGIVFDLTQAVGRTLNVPVHYMVLPRVRLEAAAEAGQIDVFCYFNPAWAQHADKYLFSAPLFDASDVLIGARNAPPVSNLAQLTHGATVGTVIGYVYPSLTRQFKDSSVLREDGADQDNVLLKLSLGRSRYAVVNSRMLAWFKRQFPGDTIAGWHLPLERSDFYCGVIKTATHNSQVIVDALNRLKANGQINTILQKYE